MTWKKGNEGCIDVRRGDNYLVAPLLLSFLLRPYLSFRPPDLKCSEKRTGETRFSLSYTSAVYHLSSLPSSFCSHIHLSFPSHQLERKATSCLVPCLPASVCVRWPLQGLGIIRSKEIDAHWVCLVTEHCVSADTGTVMRATTSLLPQNQFNHATCASCTLYL